MSSMVVSRDSVVCASVMLQDFCTFFRANRLLKIHLQPKELMHPGYLIRSSKDQQTPCELELIELLVKDVNGKFVARDKVIEILGQRYCNFDIELFECCVAEFLRIERGIADGSIQTTEVIPGASIF